jgi:peptidoglycan/LPS O-acetylase OafA/YrhL
MTTVVSSYHHPTYHIDSLDGIRGVAVIMVLLLHADWFNNGWIGVDLFFVLSGFLITGILRRSRGEPFYWQRFYIKRAARIFPPALLGITMIAVFWPHPSLIGLGGYLLSLGNIVNFTRFNILPLGHLWSLSVEEHYYLFWPFAVLRLPRRKLLWLLGAVIITTPLGRLAATYMLPRVEPSPTYYLTPFRIDGLALGSLLALLIEQRCWQERLKRWSGPGIVLTSAAYLFLWTVLGHSHFYPFSYSPSFNGIGYSLVAITGFLVVGYAYLLPDAVLTRILRQRVLVKVGEISYGLYVYSWILLVLIKHSWPLLSSREASLIHIVVSVGVSAILFKYYESPITAWGRRVAAQLATRATVTKKNDAPDTVRHVLETPV